MPQVPTDLLLITILKESVTETMLTVNFIIRELRVKMADGAGGTLRSSDSNLNNIRGRGGSCKDIKTGRLNAWTS